MRRKRIEDLLESSNITQELKEAYTFMLLSKGYSLEEIKVLDDYVFIARKKEHVAPSDVETLEYVGNVIPRKRGRRNSPSNLVNLTSKSEAYNNKDHTLYSLNGGELTTKGRLVWMIIGLYQKEHNPTFEEIFKLFNNKLHLLKHTIIDVSSLSRLSPDRQKRFYFHDSDILVSRDGVQYAVSNQWSINKMDEIITFARSNGWTVEVNQPRKEVSNTI